MKYKIELKKGFVMVGIEGVVLVGMLIFLFDGCEVGVLFI